MQVKPVGAAVVQARFGGSAHLGTIVTHYVSSTNKDVKTIAAGLTPRVLELFQLTKVDTIIPLAPTVDQAQ